MRFGASVLLVVALAIASVRAQNQPPLGVMYTCDSGRSKLKISQCSGSPDMVCDVQSFDSSDPPKATGTAQLSREQLAGRLRSCVLPDGRPAMGGGQAPGATSGRPANPSASNAPLKIGDTVEVYSLFGWTKVQIVEIQGTQLRVHYPDGQEIRVEVRNLRRVPGTTIPARFAPDPKPDVGCGGKIEGIYSDDVGVFSIAFSSGKARVTQFSGTYEAECEIRGDRIFLRGPRQQDSFYLTRKDDRRLEADGMGEIRKK